MEIKLFSNSAEYWLKLDDKLIILSPINAKKLLLELQDKIEEYEKEFGKIPETEKQEAFTQSLVKNLFHNKKISKNLYMANTHNKTKK